MGCCRSWDQFWLLVWKNWLLQKKRIPLTIVQILLPAVFAFILLLFRLLIVSSLISSPTVFSNFTVQDLNYSKLVSTNLWPLAYTPNTTLTARIMNRAVGLMNMTTSLRNAYDSEQDLVESLSMPESRVFGGIVFQLGSDNSTLPKDVTYKIRLKAEQLLAKYSSSSSGSAKSGWLTEFMYPTMPVVGPRGGNDTYGGDIPGYYYEGFLTIQRGLDLSIIQEINNGFNASSVETKLKRYPYPPYNNDKYILILQTQFSFIILLCFVVIAPTICKDIVLEKEKKLKESMKLMGMRPWLHWMSWFFKFIIFMIISIIIMTIFFHIKTHHGAIFNYTAASITFVFLFLYVLSLITFCFAVSTFFSKASSGAAAGGIIYFASYIPYFFIQFRYDTMSLGAKIGASLDFNLAMAFGCIKIAQYEGLAIGVQWSNIAQPVIADDNLTMLHVFIMLIIDTVIYSIITWYFDALLPGEFGTPQPFYFPLTKWYWCGSSSSKLDDHHDNEDKMLTLISEDRRDYFEKSVAGAKPGIRIRGLTKQFNKKLKPAVDNLNIDIYEGNITALLGHNGAGKTTTMFLLTGFLSPSAGTAFVNGFDIRKDMLRIRENLGLCPQHDVLFDTMTVNEHLVFFARLKGCPGSEVEEAVREMIKVLHLEDKTNAESRTLSGGMKRKLCVGIALIADSKFVILDEPTSGMDPEARRQTWDILQSQQKGRTMILSTHFMDEADLLGDRIAIMAEGEIQCYGSPMFLKNKYGIGYHLTIVKHPTCKVKELEKIIKSAVPEAVLESNVGAEVSFTLPRDQSHKFEGLFATLEKDQEPLGIANFGASVTTMEEVFLRVGEALDSTLESNLRNGQKNSGEENGKDSAANSIETHSAESWPAKNNLESMFGLKFHKVTGITWYCLQFQALFMKRVIHSVRNWIMALVQLLVPIAFAIIACVIMITLPGTKDQPPLYLSLSNFKSPVIPYDVSSSSLGNEEAVSLARCYAESSASSGSLVYLNNRSDYTKMDDFLLGVAKKDRGQYNKHYLVGSTSEVSSDPMENASLIGWFNNEAYHSIAISLSFVSNALVQCHGQPGYRIQTINHPLPWTLNTKINKDVSTAQAVGFIFAYNVSFGMAFLISTFVIFLIKEREVKAKHLQFVSGVHSVNFWLSTFAWDIINYLIPSVFIIVVIECFQLQGYTDNNNAGYVFLDFVFYGISIIPCVYVLSFLFQVASSGYVWLTVINIFTGTASVLALYILEVPSLNVADVAKGLQWVFYVIFPNFCFNKALQDLYTNFQNAHICSQISEMLNGTLFCPIITRLNKSNPCCPENCGGFCALSTNNYLAWEEPGIGRSLFFMAMQSVVFFLLLVALETDVLGCIRRSLAAGGRNRVETMHNVEEYDMNEAMSTPIDSDVARERDRLLGTPIAELCKTESVVVRDLTKIYGDFVAVSQLSVGIPYGQCFGLLGVNGAGKTTCFKMLTGDVQPSYGSAFIGDYSVSENIRKVQQLVGYCPQFDALIDQMTVKETIWMFACLRGISKSGRNRVVDTLIDRLMLSNHAKKQVKNLSGGNKRKLSIAIALVGEPPIIFLDEPTTGMDPAARRLLWNTLTSVCNSGKTLILTSHSMEECEALCTRLAIMVNGVFQCIGSVQHLKAKFNEGFSLIVKIRGTDTADAEELTKKVNRIKTFVKETFPDSFLKDCHEGLINYQVETPNLSWSRIFGTIEQAKEDLEIEDYSVSQTTLEQLFISFARKQREPQELKVSCSQKCKDLFCCCC